MVSAETYANAWTIEGMKCLIDSTNIDQFRDIVYHACVNSMYLGIGIGIVGGLVIGFLVAQRIYGSE